MTDLKKVVSLSYLLGLDFGTTGLKAFTIDLEGNIIAEAFQVYVTKYFKGGTWTEQDPDNWWKALNDCTKEISSKVDFKEIAGVGISSMECSPLPIDKKGEPLRPCILWTDQRSVKQMAYIRDIVGQERIYEITGMPIRGKTIRQLNYTSAKILWIKSNQPEIFEKTWKFLDPGGFIIYRLTEQATSDFSQGSASQLLDIRKKKWSDALCKKIGIPGGKLPELGASTEVVGETSSVSEREIGLAKGTPIVRGGGDSVIGVFGAGATEAGVICDYQGTVESINASVDRPIFDKNKILRNYVHVIPDKWVIESVGWLSGGSYRWFKEAFCQTESEAAEKLGLSAYEIMDMEAEKVPPGSDGVIFLPPVFEIEFKSTFFGLTAAHRKPHLIRAVLEGNAYQLRSAKEYFQKAIKVKEMVVTGGGVKSRLWMQIKADVTETPIVIPKVYDVSPFGAALLAGVGVGIFKDCKEASNLIQVSKTVKPREENFEVYRRRYDSLGKKIEGSLVKK